MVAPGSIVGIVAIVAWSHGQHHRSAPVSTVRSGQLQAATAATAGTSSPRESGVGVVKSVSPSETSPLRIIEPAGISSGSSASFVTS
uniref:Putative secreted protein n=1 Tax=Ixodes ricinus TaxID=34613 RepID=A0A6B0UB55_IXORI